MSPERPVEAADDPNPGEYNLREASETLVQRHSGSPPGVFTADEARVEGEPNALENLQDQTEWQRTTSQADIRARDIVRLFQCRLCSKPFRDVVSLPCGKSICRKCIPETYTRANITYPSLPERLQGFRCPFEDCAREHTPGDCSPDVILNKAVQFMRDHIGSGMKVAAQLQIATPITSVDPWHVAGVSSLSEPKYLTNTTPGGKLVATWTLAEHGDLLFETEVSYDQVTTPTSSDYHDGTGSIDASFLQLAKNATRAEMDCQVCYALCCDPLTTGCGHTFCRACLARILDHSRHCPVCRRNLSFSPLLDVPSCPSNESLSQIIEMFWGDELLARKEALSAEGNRNMGDFDTSIFVCNLSFPNMPTFLHVFEPKYRLMIRRALESNRTFGMVMPKERVHAGETPFAEMGTLLRIQDVHYYPDGRSLIETTGISRFKIRRHGMLDGYMVGDIEKVDDVSLEEEESTEANEISRRRSLADAPDRRGSWGGRSSRSSKRSSSRMSLSSAAPSSESATAGSPVLPQNATEDEEESPTTLAALETMTTTGLMRFASSFVTRMQGQSVPWLAHRIIAIYGECPEDPALFPWWFASILPLRDAEKYRLLETSSVRDRLKICCAWILEWENNSWYVSQVPL